MEQKLQILFYNKGTECPKKNYYNSHNYCWLCYLQKVGSFSFCKLQAKKVIIGGFLQSSKRTQLHFLLRLFANKSNETDS